MLKGSAYQDACDRAGLVDFAEILLRSYELLQQQPTLLRHYQQRFRHMLVDEFQDTTAFSIFGCAYLPVGTVT